MRRLVCYVICFGGVLGFATPRTPPLWQRGFFLVNCFVLRRFLALERSGVVKTFRCATQTNVLDGSMEPTAKQGQYLAFIYY